MPTFSIGFGKFDDAARLMSGRTVIEGFPMDTLWFDGGGEPGDSGAPVFHSETGRVLGILLGESLSGPHRGDGGGVTSLVIDAYLLGDLGLEAPVE